MSRVVLKLILASALSIAGIATSGASERGPGRVVSADAGVTEIIARLGAADRLVAIDSSSQLPDQPDLPRLGYHRALAAEGLLGLDPDLVIGSEVMGPPHVIDTLERAGVNVLQLPVPSSVNHLRHNVHTIASAVDSDRSDAVLAKLDDLAKRIESGTFDGEAGAFLLRGEGGKLRLAGGATGGAGFLALLGAGNVADYDGYRSVTPEGLIALEPDILILADTEGEGISELLELHPVLRFSNAIREGRLYTVDPQTLVAGISLSALLEAARILAGADIANR